MIKFCLRSLWMPPRRSRATVLSRNVRGRRKKPRPATKTNATIDSIAGIVTKKAKGYHSHLKKSTGTLSVIPYNDSFWIFRKLK